MNNSRTFIPEPYPVKEHLTREEIAVIKEKAAVLSAGRRWNAPGGMVEAMLMNPREVLLLADLCLDLYDRLPAEVGEHSKNPLICVGNWIPSSEGMAP